MINLIWGWWFHYPFFAQLAFFIAKHPDFLGPCHPAGARSRGSLFRSKEDVLPRVTGSNVHWTSQCLRGNNEDLTYVNYSLYGNSFRFSNHNRWIDSLDIWQPNIEVPAHFLAIPGLWWYPISYQQALLNQFPCLAWRNMETSQAAQGTEVMDAWTYYAETAGSQLPRMSLTKV